MNFLVNTLRALVFGFHSQVFLLHPKVLILVLLDLPGILFFSTCTLLVLFWAEIYRQARSLSTYNFRLVYISINAAVYFIQVCIWLYLWIDHNSVIELVGNIFIVGTDDLKKIVNGGWCGWKKAVDSKGKNFFLHDNFYNLLLPQRPNMV
ncbi:hypothetical protein S83_066370 [Arachis hypogaea]|uniref:Tobamovirus multiplication protein n=1 Tax=Arachis hypogaea TaxID=3818 RepID=A0A6B9V809_ARAHY|nr:Tobamovirus multiplication protein [Arachis hypogaea]